MKIVLKTGQTYPVDVEKSGAWYYQTPDGKIYADVQIDRIEDECRSKYGVCKSCHSVIKLTDVDQHYAEQEAKICDINCPYCDRKVIDAQIVKTEPVIKTDQAVGPILIETTQTTTTSKLTCVYNPHMHQPHVACLYEQCRAGGITPYSEDNVLRLRYPKQRPDFRKASDLEQYGFHMQYTHEHRRKSLRYIIDANWEITALVEMQMPIITVNNNEHCRPMLPDDNGKMNRPGNWYTNCIRDENLPIIAFGLTHRHMDSPQCDNLAIIPEYITQKFFIHDPNIGWRAYNHIPNVLDDALEQSLFQLVKEIAPYAFENTGIFDTNAYKNSLNNSGKK